MAASGGGTDRNYFLRILEAPGPVQDYFLFRVDGREMLSAPFEFRLTLRTAAEVPLPAAWIGASVTFSMGGSDTVARKINGQCARFEHAGNFAQLLQKVQESGVTLFGFAVTAIEWKIHGEGGTQIAGVLGFEP